MPAVKPPPTVIATWRSGRPDLRCDYVKSLAWLPLSAPIAADMGDCKRYVPPGRRRSGPLGVALVRTATSTCREKHSTTG
jgi:hypothetical protein